MQYRRRYRIASLLLKFAMYHFQRNNYFVLMRASLEVRSCL
nr:MAG TPA: hypothetical protein [Caudoviricetes sp.]